MFRRTDTVLDNSEDSGNAAAAGSVTAIGARRLLLRQWLSDLQALSSVIDDAEADEEGTNGIVRPAASDALRTLVFRQPTTWRLARVAELQHNWRALFDGVWRSAAAVCLLSGVANGESVRRARSNCESTLLRVLGEYRPPEVAAAGVDVVATERALRKLVQLKLGLAPEQRAADTVRLEGTPRPGTQLEPADWADVCATLLFVAEYMLGATPAVRALMAPIAWRGIDEQPQQQGRTLPPPPPQQPAAVAAVEEQQQHHRIRRRITPAVIARPLPLLPQPQLPDNNNLAEQVARALEQHAAEQREAAQRREQRISDTYAAIDDVRRRLGTVAQLRIAAERLRASFSTDGEARRRIDERGEAFARALHDDVRRLAQRALQLQRSEDNAAAAAAAAEVVHEAVATLGPPQLTVEQVAAQDVRVLPTRAQAVLMGYEIGGGSGADVC
jgi:hypothetical protein